jgi:hypothetical protein
LHFPFIFYGSWAWTVNAKTESFSDVCKASLLSVAAGEPGDGFNPEDLENFELPPDLLKDLPKELLEGLPPDMQKDCCIM